MKETTDVYCPKLTQIMNNCLKKIFFSPDILKNAEVTPSFKIIDQLASCQNFQKFLRGQTN